MLFFKQIFVSNKLPLWSDKCLYLFRMICCVKWWYNNTFLSKANYSILFLASALLLVWISFWIQKKISSSVLRSNQLVFTLKCGFFGWGSECQIMITESANFWKAEFEILLSSDKISGLFYLTELLILEKFEKVWGAVHFGSLIVRDSGLSIWRLAVFLRILLSINLDFTYFLTSQIFFLVEDWPVSLVRSD